MYTFQDPTTMEQYWFCAPNKIIFTSIQGPNCFSFNIPYREYFLEVEMTFHFLLSQSHIYSVAYLKWVDDLEHRIRNIYSNTVAHVLWYIWVNIWMVVGWLVVHIKKWHIAILVGLYMHKHTSDYMYWPNYLLPGHSHIIDLQWQVLPIGPTDVRGMPPFYRSLYLVPHT